MHGHWWVLLVLWKVLVVMWGLRGQCTMNNCTWLESWKVGRHQHQNLLRLERGQFIFHFHTSKSYCSKFYITLFYETSTLSWNTMYVPIVWNREGPHCTVQGNNYITVCYTLLYFVITLLYSFNFNYVVQIFFHSIPPLEKKNLFLI